MKQILILCLIVVVLLTGCHKEMDVPAMPQATAPETTMPETTVPEITVPETTVPATTEPEITEPETTEPETTVPETTVPEITEPETVPTEDTGLVIPNVPVEDVITWFNEVVLDTEFFISGDATLVQKWEMPIRYFLHGEPTQEDIAVLESFAAWLNAVEGFPGIYPADFEMQANLQIHFTDEQGLLSIMGQEYTNSDGAVTFWYDTENRIYQEIICIRTDLDQYLRNSVILEEIYNGLGPVQDTSLREDSLIYQGYSEPQSMTSEDELLLKLLYHPDILCGMNAAECEAVIRSLYS